MARTSWRGGTVYFPMHPHISITEAGMSSNMQPIRLSRVTCVLFFQARVVFSARSSLEVEAGTSSILFWTIVPRLLIGNCWDCWEATPPCTSSPGGAPGTTAGSWRRCEPEYRPAQRRPWTCCGDSFGCSCGLRRFKPRQVLKQRCTDDFGTVDPFVKVCFGLLAEFLPFNADLAITIFAEMAKFSRDGKFEVTSFLAF